MDDPPTSGNAAQLIDYGQTEVDGVDRAIVTLDGIRAMVKMVMVLLKL